MRIVLQRVSRGSVTIDGAERREIEAGLVLLVGICPTDNEAIAGKMAEKTANLRIFEDENGAMNRSLLDVAGQALVVSNFTLYANCQKGRRPSFVEAAMPEVAEPLYTHFAQALQGAGVGIVKTGGFGADMQVELCNDGPVTIVLDSDSVLPADKKGGSPK